MIVSLRLSSRNGNRTISCPVEPEVTYAVFVKACPRECGDGFSGFGKKTLRTKSRQVFLGRTNEDLLGYPDNKPHEGGPTALIVVKKMKTATPL
jgi:hypothetical protein